MAGGSASRRGEGRCLMTKSRMNSREWIARRTVVGVVRGCSRGGLEHDIHSLGSLTDQFVGSFHAGQTESDNVSKVSRSQVVSRRHTEL
jgi:hypothetical protein